MFMLEIAPPEFQHSSRRHPLAWLLALSPVIVPIPGTRSIAHLEENVGALGVPLTLEEAMAL
jgi:pyridoxine 4-dehydrogenase